MAAINETRWPLALTVTAAAVVAALVLAWWAGWFDGTAMVAPEPAATGTVAPAPEAPAVPAAPAQ